MGEDLVNVFGPDKAADPKTAGPVQAVAERLTALWRENHLYVSVCSVMVFGLRGSIRFYEADPLRWSDYPDG